LNTGSNGLSSILGNYKIKLQTCNHIITCNCDYPELQSTFQRMNAAQGKMHFPSTHTLIGIQVWECSLGVDACTILLVDPHLILAA